GGRARSPVCADGAALSETLPSVRLASERGQSRVHSNACREVALGTATGIGRDAVGGSVARHLCRAIGPDPTEGVEPEGGERSKFLRAWNRLASIFHISGLNGKRGRGFILLRNRG